MRCPLAAPSLGAIEKLGPGSKVFSSEGPAAGVSVNCLVNTSMLSYLRSMLLPATSPAVRALTSGCGVSANSSRTAVLCGSSWAPAGSGCVGVRDLSLSSLGLSGMQRVESTSPALGVVGSGSSVGMELALDVEARSVSASASRCSS
eukprot:7601131-Pyramimonas_sp.AAC.1